MLASVIVEQVIYQRLLTGQAITDTVGENLLPLNQLPQDARVPALLYHMEMGDYPDEPVGSDDISMEELRFAVRLICEGESTNPILEAAFEQQELLAGQIADVEFRDHTYRVEMVAAGEFPLQTVREGAQFYRQLGTVYNVTVTKTN